ncbi:MAG TPA: hypothetical protein VIP70_04180 [Nitrososphaeraceae archaeon]
MSDAIVASDDKGEYNNIILLTKKMANIGDSIRELHISMLIRVFYSYGGLQLNYSALGITSA